MLDFFASTGPAKSVQSAAPQSMDGKASLLE